MGTVLEDAFLEWASQFKSGDGIGEYSYSPGRKTTLYGSTDMLISFFVLGLTKDLSESDKDAWAATINSFQDPETGIYRHESWEKASEKEEHATAFAVSALTLINRTTTHPMTKFLALQANQSQWEPWISNVKGDHQWDHIVSGVWAALKMTGELEQNFSDYYFDWMNSQADPRSGGFVCPGKVHSSKPPQLKWMTCYVHVLWQFAFANKTWAYADAMLNWTMQMHNSSSGYFCRSPGAANPGADCNKNPRSKGLASNVNPSCHQLDGVWTVTRSAALLDGYRWDDVRDMCSSYLHAAATVFADTTVLMDHVVYGDSHGLNGGLQSIAECVRWFPELVHTRRPWRISLDYASFM